MSAQVSTEVSGAASAGADGESVVVSDGSGRQVGARLRAVRVSTNLSQLELSRRSGIAQESLSRIETGWRDPRLGTLRRLAQGMGLSLDQLLERLRVDSGPALKGGSISV